MAKTVLINGQSRYIGDNLAKWISNQKPGSTLEDAGEEEDGGTDAPANATENFQIYQVSHQQTKSEIQELAMNSDIIVWSVTDFSDSNCIVSDVSDGEWLIDTLAKCAETFETQKQFILVSTVATWARTKPNEDPDLGFDEANFRTRRGHLNFKEHLALEKLVIKVGKNCKPKLSCHVVASALQYGLGESCFHYMFKQPWLDVDREVAIYGSGKNKLPTIHINDLSQIICNVIDHKPQQKYIVAVDESVNTLGQITKTVTGHLGHGRYTKVKDAASLANSEEDVTSKMADLLLLDLQFDQGDTIKEIFNINWQGQNGIVDSMEDIISEYRIRRKLLPVRIGICGPPQVGKSALARKLANEYQLHVIKSEDLVEQTLELLQSIIAHAEAKRAQLEEENEGEEAEEEDFDMDGQIEAATELKQEIEEALTMGPRLEDDLFCRIFKYHLTSKKCKNQGFILDGFPKTKAQAEILFALEDDEIEDNEDGELQTVSYLPELIVGLEASDDWLKQRVMNLPEESVQGTHNDEENFLNRLATFRTNNEEDTSPYTYFDENEVHPKMYNLEGSIDPTEIDEKYGMEKPHPAEEPNDGSYSAILTHLRKLIGKPRNYGPTAKELEEIHLVNERKRREQAELEAKQLKEQQELEEKTRKQRMTEWAERLQEVQKQEAEAFEAASLPSRNYLMKFVMPTLTKAMHECTKVRPEDPVDFIAEYLFKHNPQFD